METEIEKIVNHVYRNNPFYLAGRQKRLFDAGILSTEWNKKVDECLEHFVYYDTARAILDIAVTSFAKQEQ